MFPVRLPGVSEGDVCGTGGDAGRNIRRPAEGRAAGERVEETPEMIQKVGPPVNS